VDPTANLEAMLAHGKDSPMIRFALGSEYLRLGKAELAVKHFDVAVALDPDYSAAWKLLGKAQTDAGFKDRAADAYRRGIIVAERRGDHQAVREMQVFLKRLDGQA